MGRANGKAGTQPARAAIAKRVETPGGLDGASEIERELVAAAHAIAIHLGTLTHIVAELVAIVRDLDQRK